METITLTIPTMKSSHCQMTVANTVKNLGATLKDISPGGAVIELTMGLTKETLIEAIKKAGYSVTNG